MSEVRKVRKLLLVEEYVWNEFKARASKRGLSMGDYLKFLLKKDGGIETDYI